MSRETDRKYRENLIKRLNDNYPFLGMNNAKLIEEKAWEEGHACGYHEVEIYLDEYIDFALSIYNNFKKNKEDGNV